LGTGLNEFLRCCLRPISARYLITVFREKAPSALAGFYAGPLAWSNWNLEKLVFVEGGKPWNSERTLGARREPTTNSMHICHQNRAQATAAGEGGGRVERVLSPLRHPCSPNKQLYNMLRFTPVKTGYISRGTASYS